MKREIGSDFWDMPVSEKSEQFAISGIPSAWSYTFFVSGRSAIYAAAKQIEKRSGIVLMPYYTCETISDAFLKAGYSLVRYSVRKDLSFDTGAVLQLLKQYNPDILFVQGYFGFDTTLDPEIISETAHQNGAVLMEDLTHSLFSEIPRTDADIFISSLRKFFGIPDGGFAVAKNPISAKDGEARQKLDMAADKAFSLKAAYISDLNNDQKQEFLDSFSDLKHLIADSDEEYRISDAAAEQLNYLNKKYIIEKRRDNFVRLHQGLSKLSWIEPLREKLLPTETPLFYPVYVPTELRNSIRSYFAANEVYLPVIWPKDHTLQTSDAAGDEIYGRILCFPCDQRSDADDMYRVIRLGNAFLGE